MSCKVLFLTPQLPYPPKSGGTIKSFRLIKFLSENYPETTLVSLIKGEDVHHVESFKRAVSLGNMFFVEVNRPRSIINLIISYFKKIPMSIYRNEVKSLKKHLSAIVKGYDIIIVDHFLMFQYVPIDFKGKIVLHQHNAEFVMWDRLSLMERNLLKKILLKVEALRIRAYEEKIIKRSSKVVIAPNDFEVFSNVIPENKYIKTYHLSDDALLFLPAISYEKTCKTILYVGTLTWDANIDGLKWFLEKVWIKITDPDVRLVVVGKRNISDVLTNWQNDSRIDWLGFVENLDELYSTSRVFVAPLRYGSGIKVKVVSSLYRGLPAVTTDIGVEGLKVEDGKELMIANNAEAFADRVKFLLENKQAWESMSKISRKYALDELTWDKVLKNFNGAILND